VSARGMEGIKGSEFFRVSGGLLGEGLHLIRFARGRLGVFKV